MVAIENINQKDLKNFIQNKKLASRRVIEWIGTYSKLEISTMLDISRPTLNVRLEENNWKMSEIKLIHQNMPF